MVEPLRWGVVSTALINDKVLAAAAKSSLVDVVAVASRDPARAVEYAARKGISRAYGSYDEMLAADDVEAVYISLPNGLHHEWTMRALHAGKHVLCEKPYSRVPDEVVEAFTEAMSRGLVLSEAFMYRYHPQITILKQLVSDGVVGDLSLVASAFSWPTEYQGDVRLDPDLDGGSLLDVGVYCVSTSRLLAGEPLAVTAQTSVGASGVDTTVVGTMQHEGGVLSHFDCGFHIPDRSSLEVVGTGGVVTVNDPWHGNEPRLTVTPTDAPSYDVPVPSANSYALELEEFGRAVRGEANNVLGLADALGQARTIDALFRSAETGTRQQLTHLG